MPNYPAVYAIEAALRYLRQVGVPAIYTAAQPLTEHCLREIARLPVELLTPLETNSLAGIIAFRHPDAERIQRQLHQRGVHIMAHAGRLRVAIHGYNTAADVETLLRELHTAL
jgi:selenocysteine lyase/cysteine desulfurase